MEEIWKNIKGFEGKYQISNLGNVKSLKRSFKLCNGGIKEIEEHILKCSINNAGYKIVSFYDNDTKKIIPKLIHRLVAEYFLDNPNNYTEVNHKDENKLNNTVENLEWCSHKYNVNYGVRSEKMRNSMNKTVKNREWVYFEEQYYESGYNYNGEFYKNKKEMSLKCGLTINQIKYKQFKHEITKELKLFTRMVKHLPSYKNYITTKQ